MPQPDEVTVFGTPKRRTQEPDIQKIVDDCKAQYGFVPNLFRAYADRPSGLRNLWNMYIDLVYGESGLSSLEREMIATVVSSANHCYYCLVSHGQTVRQLSGDPELGEMMVMNYRVAHLDERQRAMLDFAWKLTEAPNDIVDADRQRLKRAGLSERDIWDLGEVAAFFNYTNRVAHVLEMIPNHEYHAMNRPEPFVPPPPAG